MGHTVFFIRPKTEVDTVSPFPTITRLQKGVLFILPSSKTGQRKDVRPDSKPGDIQRNG